ncbi:MAG TPA: hypothetical protein VIT42_13310 [Microlunatus sp.]
MSDPRPEQSERDQPAEGGQASEGGSGFGGAETSGGGADAVPSTPDNVPADGAE